MRDEAVVARLFHYTSVENWQKIRASGQIIATSIGSAHSELGDAPLLWLSDSMQPETTGLTADRTRIRIAVGPVPHVRYWPMWRSGVIDPTGLEQRPHVDPSTWYVTLQSIPSTAWGEVVNLETGRVERPGRTVFPVEEWGPAPTVDEVELIGVEIRAAYDKLVTDVENDFAAAEWAYMRRGYDEPNGGPLGLEVAMMAALAEVGGPHAPAAWRTLLEEAKRVEIRV